jgi:hypothetical protein
MCMGDFADGTINFSDSYPRAAFPHRCDECGRTIPRGEEYERATGLTDDFFFTSKTCLHCVVAREWLRVICSTWLYGAVGEDLGEHRYEDPYCTVGLLRLIAGMNRRWAWRGGLVPIERVREWVAQALAPIRTEHRGAT